MARTQVPAMLLPRKPNQSKSTAPESQNVPHNWRMCFVLAWNEECTLRRFHVKYDDARWESDI